MSEIPIGTRGEASLVVGEAQLARTLGSGTVRLFGTPALVALCEAAALRAVAPYLDEGQTTVGSAIAMRHLGPTAPGREVRAVATVVAAEGRRLRFALEAWDDVERIGEGEHERAIVDEARFMDRAWHKSRK